MQRHIEECKIILSSSSPLSNNTKIVINEFFELLNKNKSKIDLFELYRNIPFKNDSIELYFIKFMTNFIDRSEVFSLITMRSVICELNEKSKTKQIMEFIPSHIRMIFRDRTLLEKNFSSIFSQIKFYIILLVNEAKSNRNRDKVAELMKLCLDQIVELLKYSITIQKSACFIEVLTNILTPQFKLFQILCKYHINIYDHFVKNLVNELINSNYSFVLKPNEIENFPIYYLFTKLLVELFSEKLSIDFSLNLFKQLLKNMMIKFAENIYISRLLKNFMYFGEYLNTFNNFDKFVKLSTQLFDKNELTYDFLVTICEIINRIGNADLIARAKVENLEDFTKIFEFLSKFIVSANIEKTFCSHCTNVKRHSILNYGKFYINYYRNLCKNNFKFCNEENLAKSVNIIKYTFIIWDSLQCSTADQLFDVMYTLNYNFAVTLSNTTDMILNETSIVVLKILLKYFKNNKNLGITLDNIVSTMLRGFKICYSNNLKYLELYCFFIIMQLANKEIDRNIIIGHVQRIVQQFWTDEAFEIHPTFIEVLESIGDSLYEIPKPKYDEIDVIILVLETVSNYRSRTNIRVNSLQKLFKYANCNTYLKIGEFLSTYKYIDHLFFKELTLLYDNVRSLTKNPLLLGLLKHKIFIVHFEKITEIKKSQVYDIDFENNLNMFDSEKISNESTLVRNLFESLDYLTKFIQKNFDKIKDLKYENLIEVLLSIGQNLYFRDYKIESTIAFGLLLALSLELDYEDGIIDGLNYFFNNYTFYQMFLNSNTVSGETIKLPPTLEDLLEINSNIITKRGNCDNDRVLINYLNYSKYLIDMNRTNEFFKIIKIFLKLYLIKDSSVLISDMKYYHLKLLLLIIYYKINNDNEKINSSTIFKDIMQFFICYKNVKYVNLTERFETYNLLFDTMEYLSDFVISKRLFYEKDFYLITIIRFALKVGAIKRLLSFLRFSIKLDILTETFGQINFKLTCFNRIVENTCYFKENINIDGIGLKTKDKNTITNIEQFKSNRIDVPKTPFVYKDCPIRRNYNIHVDDIESIVPLEFDLDFESSNLHQRDCNCFMCNSDLRIHLFYLDICLLIVRKTCYQRENKTKSLQMFQNCSSHINYLKTKYKGTYDFTINLDYYHLMKIHLYECLAHLHLVDRDYENAKKTLIKSKNIYNLTRKHLPIGYYQNILIQLKLLNDSSVDSKFVVSTVINSLSYDLCSTREKIENQKICRNISEPISESKKKKSPKVKCISIKKPSSSSLDSNSPNSTNKNKLALKEKRLDFPKEQMKENVTEIIDSPPVMKTALTPKTVNAIETKAALQSNSRNKIEQPPQKRTLRTRAKR